MCEVRCSPVGAHYFGLAECFRQRLFAAVARIAARVSGTEIQLQVLEWDNLSGTRNHRQRGTKGAKYICWPKKSHCDIRPTVLSRYDEGWVCTCERESDANNKYYRKYDGNGSTITVRISQCRSQIRTYCTDRPQHCRNEAGYTKQKKGSDSISSLASFLIKWLNSPHQDGFAVRDKDIAYLTRVFMHVRQSGSPSYVTKQSLP